MTAPRIPRRAATLEPTLRAARWRTIRSEVAAVLWRGLVATMAPALVLYLLHHRDHAVAVAAISFPGLVLLAEHAARRAALRFDRYAQVLAPEALGPQLALATSVDDARELALSMALAARQEAQEAQAQRRAAVERERLTAEGMAALFLRRVYAEERAMAVLAAELHDTAAQSLTLARIAAADGQPPAAVHAELVLADKQLRGVLALTSPPELEAGLADAVSKLLVEMRQQFDLRVTVTGWASSSTAAVEQPVATTIYRFYQETLRNVVKHSRQLHAELELSDGGGKLVATVRDDGVGFEPSATHPSAGHHVGLYLLDDRARAIGADLDITSVLGHGTVARLLVPQRRSVVAEGDSPLPEGEQLGLGDLLDAL